MPLHPWQAERIEKEGLLIKHYGLTKKREIWKMDAVLKDIKIQAKNLAARKDAQAKKEEQLLLERLQRLGILSKEAPLETVLDMTIEKILERRLQTYILKIGLARTVKQARQMITHGHVFVHGKKIDSPSYLVQLEDEGHIVFATTSPFTDNEHPERVVRTKEEQAKEKRRGVEVKKHSKEIKEVKEEKIEEKVVVAVAS